MTFGRLTANDGSTYFAALASSSIGSENTSRPQIGPLVVDQIMYHAADEADDFVRLVNVSSDTVDLATRDTRWKITGGISFTFGDNDRLLPGQHAFVSSTEPVLFRARYGIPGDVPVFGPFAGKLSDTSDTIRIHEEYEDGRRVLSDEVAYRDVAPWPIASVQTDVPLTRRDASWLGSDPSNWIGLPMTAGAHLGKGAFARQFAVVQDAPVLEANYLGYFVEVATAGDANGDGRFDSRDLVQIFQAGLYEAGSAADWLTGDWNQDGVFSTRDLVAAFEAGEYLS
jgi:hypothetical protein